MPTCQYKAMALPSWQNEVLHLLVPGDNRCSLVYSATLDDDSDNDNDNTLYSSVPGTVLSTFKCISNVIIL